MFCQRRVGVWSEAGGCLVRRVGVWSGGDGCLVRGLSGKMEVSGQEVSGQMEVSGQGVYGWG